MITFQTLYNYIFTSTFVCFFFVIWFMTDVLMDYLRAMKADKIKFIDNFFLISEYKNMKDNDLEIFNYTDFLQKTLSDTPSLGKLLSCKYCIGFWITTFSCVIFGGLINCSLLEIIMVAPASYLTSLLLYDKLFETK